MELCSAAVAASAWDGLSEVEPLVRGWLWRRCSDRAAVDDVVQDTLLRAARYRRALSRPERLASWALSIAANTLRDRVRSAPVERVAEADEYDLEQFPCTQRPLDACGDESLLRIGGRVVTCSDAVEHLRAALRTLKAQDAQLLLEYYGGLDIQALTARSGLRASGVKCRLHRGRRRLARELERRLGLQNSPAPTLP